MRSRTALAAAYADGDVDEMWKTRDRQVPMEHLGDARDVGNAAPSLASDEACCITGIELFADRSITGKIA